MSCPIAAALLALLGLAPLLVGRGMRALLESAPEPDPAGERERACWRCGGPAPGCDPGEAPECAACREASEAQAG